MIERAAPDRQSLDVETRDGREETPLLPHDSKFARSVAAKLADVKPGADVGDAAAPGEGDALKALEARIFPESRRGVGEGFRPLALAPGGATTNGVVEAGVDAVGGLRIVVADYGGETSITIGESTPIVAIEEGGLGDLMAGAAIVARGAPSQGGADKARRIVIGVVGAVPPM